MRNAYILPWYCVLCAAISDQAKDLCQACELSLPWLPVCCRQCGLVLGQEAGQCGQCLQAPPVIDRCISLWDYNTASCYLVQQLKYGQQLFYARLLAQLLAARVKAAYIDSAWPELIIPVPLHWRRLFTRGFNQSLEIAKPLAKELSLPYHARLSRRLRHTPMQAGLSAQVRRRNLVAAFSAQPLPYSHVAIVDDVVTTMSTANELARVLKAQGVKHVDLWTCIRTQLPVQA